MEFKHHHLRSEAFLKEQLQISWNFWSIVGSATSIPKVASTVRLRLLGILILVYLAFELSRNVRLFRWISWRTCRFCLSRMCNSWHGGASRWSWYFHSAKSWGHIMQEQEWKRIAFRHARKQRPPTPENETKDQPWGGSVLRGHGKRKLTTVQNVKKAMRGMSPQRAVCAVKHGGK